MLPAYPYPLQEGPAGPQIWCPLRRRYVAATPEEEVRQRLVLWLLSHVQVPPTLVAIERQVVYLNQPRRLDLLIHTTGGQPLLLCECKAPGVELSHSTVQQAASYNAVVQAPGVLLTNGFKTILLDIRQNVQQQLLADMVGWLQTRL